MAVIISVIGALAVFFLAVMAIDCNRFVIRKYKCSAGKLKRDCRIVLLSDLHNKAFGEGNRRLLEEIDRLCPDIILMAGDMYTCQRDGDIRTAGDLVCALAARYPVYYGNGNHEHKTRLYPEHFGSIYRDFTERIGKAGVSPLINEKVSLPAFNLDIYGVEIGREYYKKFTGIRMEKRYLDRLLGRPQEDRFSLLIAHNPDYFKTYAAWGADLVVSGHVHGGLMRLPILGGVISPAIRFFPKYDGGEYREGSCRMILSRGLGTHTLPIRIFNPGELAVIELCRS